MENIAKAIIKVMAEVKGIDKSMTVGTGANAYKGVPDQEVKKVIGEAMQRNGLCILPVGVSAKTEVSRWEEPTQYGTKQKQSVFTEATTKYMLLHESGESVTLEGYGHGVDTQDKGAGKATTYALKYTLLYTFLVPTGKIDDADTDHSDNHETPKTEQPAQHQQPPAQDQKDADNRPWLTEEALNKILARMAKGEPDLYEKTNDAFRMKKQYREQLKAAATQKQAA